MSREGAEDKAARYLAAGRLDVIEVSAHVIRATCRGDTGEWRLGWAGDWWCSCPAWSPATSRRHPAEFHLKLWHRDAACGAACRDPRDPARPGWWDVPAPSATEPTDDNLAAIDVCVGCPVADDCLDAAHPRHDRYSVRGGMLPAAWRADKKACA